jgi:hypothetical protein
VSKHIIPPEAIITNVPVSFFEQQVPFWGDLESVGRRMVSFKQWYLQQTDSEHAIFYHFISRVPTQDIASVFICWGGRVQVKCQVVQFIKNQPLHLPTYSHPFPRDWMVTGGPVIAPPHKILQPGFRGFRYSKMLF